MIRRRPPFLIPMLLALGITGCFDADRELPTGPNFAKVPGTASPIAQIQTRINALFPQPEKRQANKIFAQVKNALATGDEGAAQAGAATLIALGTATDLEEPRGPENAEEAFGIVLGELIVLTGLDPDLADVLANLAPDLASQVVDADEVAVVEPDEEQTVVVGTEETGIAGALFPVGWVDETVLVIIDRVELGEGEDCLPTVREQREGCFNYTTIPEQTEGFTLPVTVGVCVDVSGLSVEQIDNFHLYAFDEGDDNVRELENAAVDFLDCTEAFAVRGEGLLARFAYALSRGVGRLLEPQPLRAANRGFGGFSDCFSRIGWAGATALIYGLSMISDPDYRPGVTEETIAEALGIAVDVVSPSEWGSKINAGPGGFGDYDAIVFGDGFGGDDGLGGPLSGAESNTVWTSLIATGTGPVVVSAIHAGRHICEIAALCPGFAPAIQFPPLIPREFVETSLKYAVSGIETGLFASMNTRFGPITVSETIDWLGSLGFTALPRGPKVFGTLTDDTHFVDGAHPVLAPFVEADVSGWFLTTHNYLGVPTGYTAIAEGHFWNRPGPPFDPANEPDNPAQMTHSPVVVVRSP